MLIVGWMDVICLIVVRRVVMREGFVMMLVFVCVMMDMLGLFVGLVWLVVLLMVETVGTCMKGAMFKDEKVCARASLEKCDYAVLFVVLLILAFNCV